MFSTAVFVNAMRRARRDEWIQMRRCKRLDPLSGEGFQCGVTRVGSIHGSMGTRLHRLIKVDGG